MSLTPEQVERYARHIMLREVGGPGQQKLLNAHVAIIGLGALGGPAALHLAAAGIGHLTLIDDDIVSLSNLQRQVLFDMNDIAKPKTKCGARHLNAINPDCKVTTHTKRLTTENASELIGTADIVIDGTDNFATRFIINETCHTQAKTMVSGAIGRWNGQVSVFKSGTTKHAPHDERLPCYRCFVHEATETEDTCEAVGVIGPLTGLIGARLALEAIKEVVDVGQTLAGRIVIFDGLGGDTRTVRLRPDAKCPTCGQTETS